jgi:hypothetical protein
MNENELTVATHVLGTLFRDYLTQLREEQLQELQNSPAAPTGLPYPETESGAIMTEPR